MSKMNRKGNFYILILIFIFLLTLVVLVSYTFYEKYKVLGYCDNNTLKNCYELCGKDGWMLDCKRLVEGLIEEKEFLEIIQGGG